MRHQFHYRLFFPHRQGFTIIELLAVIAIIAILATLASSQYFKAIGYGENVQCIANLRHLHQVMSLYVTEHDGTYPICWLGPNGANTFGTWEEALANTEFDSKKAASLFSPWGGIYNGKGYTCPATPQSDITQMKLSYGMNVWLGRSNQTPPIPMRILQVKSLSKVPLMGDTWQHNEIHRPVMPESWGTVGSLNFRHNGKANVVFCDGHVESLNRTDAVTRWPNWNSFDPLAESN